MRFTARSCRHCGRSAIVFLALFATPILCRQAAAQQPARGRGPTSQPRYNVGRGPRTGGFISRPDEFFSTDEGKRIVGNIISWQNPNGGWFKNYSAATTRPAVLVDDPNSGPPGDDDSVWHKVSTFDNNATYTELRLLAKAYRVTKDPKYKESFDRGLKFVFDAQYANGGWPQRFPLQDNYGRHITYNDDAMVGIMRVLRDVYEQTNPDFALTSDAQRKQAREAFDRGVKCILDCQYRRDGKLTVWGQQHDEVTLLPAGARTYELPSLSGSESSGIIEMLESLPNPDQRIRDAIEAGYQWYEASKITGKRVGRGEGGRTMIEDPNAPPMWARFYNLQTNKPFVSDRDGIPKERLEDIGAERRNGYAWYGNWGSGVEESYKAWKAKFGGQASNQ
jgi:PelA/Pel-15E family pectate lyase